MRLVLRLQESLRACFFPSGNTPWLRHGRMCYRGTALLLLWKGYVPPDRVRVGGVNAFLLPFQGDEERMYWFSFHGIVHSQGDVKPCTLGWGAVAPWV